MTNKYTFFIGNDRHEIDEADKATADYVKLVEQLFERLDECDVLEKIKAANAHFVDSLKKLEFLTLSQADMLFLESLKSMEECDDIKSFVMGIPLPNGLYLSYDETLDKGQSKIAP